jgi:hypothetical protein
LNTNFEKLVNQFVVARAKTLSGTLITEEFFKPNECRILISAHFGVTYSGLQGLMESEVDTTPAS